MTSPVSGVEKTRLRGVHHLDKFMKSRTRTNKASLQAMATRTALLPVFAVSLITSGLAAKEQIVTFDAPGAGTGAFQGTQPFNLNAGGSIVGIWANANPGLHGFLRSADGTIITIDVPNSTNTLPEGINSGGVITGYYTDLNFVPHGWVRTATGAFTSFDPTGSGQTFPLAINAAGTIGGNFAYATDANQVSHGFIRAANGSVTVFDVPGAGTGPSNLNQGTPQGTFATADALSPAGALAGAWWDPNYVQHGFVRNPDGSITKIDVSGASGLNTTGISSTGVVLGYYTDANGLHGFIRATNGTITTFDALGMATLPFGINAQGTITGNYFDTNGVQHGFVRNKDGSITTVDAPNAGTSAGQGTVFFGINQAGSLAGYYVDPNNVFHGVVVTGE
jgi:hypothetical protein